MKTSATSGITNAFFSDGTIEEMSTSTISAPLQERLWCDDEEASQTDDTTTATTSAPSSTKPGPSTTPKPTRQPSKLPTKKPTKVRS